MLGGRGAAAPEVSRDGGDRGQPAGKREGRRSPATKKRVSACPWAEAGWLRPPSPLRKKCIFPRGTFP